MCGWLPVTRMFLHAQHHLFRLLLQAVDHVLQLPTELQWQRLFYTHDRGQHWWTWEQDSFLFLMSWSGDIFNSKTTTKIWSGLPTTVWLLTWTISSPSESLVELLQAVFSRILRILCIPLLVTNCNPYNRGWGMTRQENTLRSSIGQTKWSAPKLLQSIAK